GTGTMVNGNWPNGASPFYIDPRPAGGGAGVTAVPTMDAWGLGIMAALLGAAAARRRQKKKG
ncbi:MAG: IPTL-CTERM sorting domain-containing protein, partial [Comamonadaceae bacterium]|nr:IPTL-CTERM sorting domain-containing protein [Comamonadaceae bacterium]